LKYTITNTDFDGTEVEAIQEAEEMLRIRTSLIEQGVLGSVKSSHSLGLYFEHKKLRNSRWRDCFAEILTIARAEYNDSNDDAKMGIGYTIDCKIHMEDSDAVSARLIVFPESRKCPRCWVYNKEDDASLCSTCWPVVSASL